ncbi:hypothetical protein [Archangium sp.]|jgi:hypothetical protein|uniref:hypothetical protein n=1 Tax=Archangium sp. TaxID=1872627 RepID=UPI002ED7FADC
MENPAVRSPLLLVLLALAALGAFAPGLTGDFVWDDSFLIPWNDYLRTAPLSRLLLRDFWWVSEPGIGASGLFRPVVKLGHLVCWHLFGRDTLGYHALNLALHLGCAFLLFSWLRRRVTAEARGALPPELAALAGALLFVLHPSRPESVTWISGGTDLWLGLFTLLALTAWDVLRWPWRGPATAAALVLALGSKETALVIPALLGAEAVLRHEGRERRHRLLEASAYQVLLGGLTWLRMQWVPLVERELPASFPATGLVERVLGTLGLYIQRALWPFPPSTVPAPFELPGGPFSVGSWVLGSGLALALVAGLVLARFRPAVRPWLADAFWFAVPLAPVLLFPISPKSMIADRLLYVPLIGLGALVARALVRLDRVPRAVRLGVLGGGIVLLVAFAGATARLSGMFQDGMTLRVYEYRLRPTLPSNVDDLVRELLSQNRYGLAQELALQRLELPSDADSRALAAATWAYTRIQTTRDTDPETLRALGRFLDALRDASQPTARLSLDGRELRVEVSPKARAAILTRRDLGHYGYYRALVFARTLELERAESLFRVVTEEAESWPAGWEAYVRSLAWQEKWDQALDTLQRAERRFGPEGWGPLRAMIQQGKAFQLRPPSDAAQAVAQRAALMSQLGLPARSYALLEGLGPEAKRQPEVIHATVQVYLSDKQFERARELLQWAQRAVPEHAQEFADALREVEGYAESELAHEAERNTLPEV